MKIIKASNNNRDDWNRYASENPQGSIYHLYEWKQIIEDSYNHESAFQIAVKKDEIVGIFPKFIMNNFILRRSIISSPFQMYGGPLGNNSEICNQFIKETKREAKKIGIKNCEVRYNPKNPEKFSDLQEGQENYSSIFLNLEHGKTKLWKNMNKKRRNSIRYASKTGLKIVKNNSYLPNFYEIYASTMKRLGTPSHSYLFFSNILKHLKNNFNLYVAKNGDQIISASLVLTFRNEATSIVNVSLPEYNNLKPNDLVYWRIIEFLIANNYKSFDFGRSSIDSGTYLYKKKWNGEDLVYNYQYYNKDGRSVSYNPNSSKNKLIKTAWQFLPLDLAKRIGPILRREIP